MAYRASKRLFVSNLPWTIGQRELYEYFAAFGPLVEHRVIFDKTTGLSKKYGFIQFGNEDGYREVMKKKTHFLEGNYLNIDDQKENRNSIFNKIRY